ncbi:glycoside hydrolase family 3 protein [Aulographum hederae CBS 113979]|uniref:Probable beta-glucosidase G n=1 Tax=Aulographum hederae CBS 113979 TaxID=1176131 RepID=A0A6G1HHH4_9PEZI|nr:glycoside hydrolase family 3 protein [Aulographum hederae CBS 113979]
MFGLGALLLIIQFSAGALGAGTGFRARRSDAERNEAWEAAVVKANAFVAQLNVTEKANMVTGKLGLDTPCIGNIIPIPRLNFKGLCLLDGPTAMNRADLVSVFPAGLTAAATWDKDLIYERGKALGEEFKAKGGHVMLGPVAGPLGRHQLGGRNWEGFSPDPYLTGLAMQATIHGIQDAGVQSCSKHFIGNEQETQRSNSFSPDSKETQAISANIDDRTMHELYLWPFADAVKAGTVSVMCSYNRMNQTYACENPEILNRLLKEELGFPGYVVSDWFATHSGAKSINAGLDLTMPGVKDIVGLLTQDSWFGGNIPTMIQDGSISDERLDDMIRRVMTPYYFLDQDKEDFPTVDQSLVFTLAASSGLSLPAGTPIIAARDVRADHAEVIRKMGAEATVLLKNVDSILPLRKPMNIGVFGNDAAEPTEGLTFPSFAFEIGTLTIGGGSGTGRHTYIVSPLEAIKARAREYGARVQHVLHNTVVARNDFTGIYPPPDVCLVFLNTFASEGYDRSVWEADWNSTQVVDNVASHCPNTIVVTHSAGINSMPWANNPNVKAILAAHLPGQESGNSIVDVLWGAVNPSGKLPYSIAANPADCDIPVVTAPRPSADSATAWQSDFTEGLLIDYRHLDARNITPLYEFGFGLSYTAFAVSGKLEIERLVANISAVPATFEKPYPPGGNPALWTPLLKISTTVKNTGSVAGATVPQLYLSMPKEATPVGTPPQVLRGFEKVFLEPGEETTVGFELMRRDVSFWDVGAQEWVVPPGTMGLRVGFSSRDQGVRRTVGLRV